MILFQNKHDEWEFSKRKLRPMKINEVPQDREDYKGRSDVHKLMYAIQEDGSYASVNSEGWEVEHMATRQAWEALLEELKEAEEKVKNGIWSPIPYFMQKNMMELPVLARYMGKWKWQIKRHFQPAVFLKLDDKILEQYSRIFNVTVADLKHFGK